MQNIDSKMLQKRGSPENSEESSLSVKRKLMQKLLAQKKAQNKEDGSDNSSEEEFNVEFKLVTPDSILHYDGTCSLLRTTFQGLIHSYTEIAKEVVEQDWLGGVVELDGDEVEGEGKQAAASVYGVCSILRMDEYAVRPSG